MAEIVKHLRAFIEEFDIPMDFGARMKACRREDKELWDVWYAGDVNSTLQEESCDRVITGLLSLMSLHVDPVHAVKEKLELTFKKYRAKKGRGANAEPDKPVLGYLP